MAFLCAAHDVSRVLRYLEVKRRAASDGARRPYAPAVRLADTSANSQAEACAGTRRSVCLPKSVEHARQIVVRNTDTRVLDGDLHGAVGIRRTHDHLSFRVGELQGVSNEI